MNVKYLLVATNLYRLNFDLYYYFYTLLSFIIFLNFERVLGTCQFFSFKYQILICFWKKKRKKRKLLFT